MENRGPAALAVTAAFTVISTVFVGLRLVSRIGFVHRMLWDDHFIVLAWLIAVGMSIAICYGTSVGLGRHQEDIPAEWDSPLKKSEYAFAVLYNPALMATKTSILIFYLSLSKTNKIFKWASVATLAVVNVVGLALTFFNIFQCRPVTAAFVTSVPPYAQCTDIITLYLSSAPVNIITDLAILFLPMPILTSMRLPRKQKIILIVTFGFGAFVTVVDVVRITYLQEVSLNRLEDIQNSAGNIGNRSRNSSDFSWYAAPSFMWSAVEVHVGLMCACVPALKPLVSRFMPRILRDVGDTAYGSGTGSPPMEHPDFGPGQQLKSVPGATSGAPAPEEPQAESSNSAEPKEEQENDMDIMDFLTTPDTNEPPSPRRIQPTRTHDTHMSRRSTAQPAFYDFVNFRRKKSLVNLTNKESIFPVAMATLLFLLWGFAYGLLDTLNAQFQLVAGMSAGQTIGLHSAYFGAYMVGPLTFGRLVLKHWGFKACFIVGLIIYGCGTLIFWPSAVLTSFPAFLVSNFIVGLGLSTLEIAANPFIALCGPSRYAEIRLNLSQGVQAVGSVCSPLLARKVLFGTTFDAPSLVQTQWAYLGIALFTILLAVAYYYVPLPEATDEELERACTREDGANDATVLGVRVIYLTLGLGVFSQFCYVGGQEANATLFNDYLDFLGPPMNDTSFQAIGHTAFAVGRFLAAAVSFFVKPRRILLFCYLGAVVFCALAMSYRGATAHAILIVIYFFEGPIFSLIYAIAIRGLGRRTKFGAAFLTASIGGGAVFPPIRHAVEGSRDPAYSYCVVLAAYAFGAVWAIYLNVLPAAKKQVDPVKKTSGEEQEERQASTASSTRRSSGLLGYVKRRSWRKDKDDGLPTREHRERASQSS